MSSSLSLIDWAIIISGDTLAPVTAPTKIFRAPRGKFDPAITLAAGLLGWMATALMQRVRHSDEVQLARSRAGRQRSRLGRTTLMSTFRSPERRLRMKAMDRVRADFLSKRAGFAVKGHVAGCPARIRTLIDGVRVRSLTIRGRGIIGPPERIRRQQRARSLVSRGEKVKRSLAGRLLALARYLE